MNRKPGSRYWADLWYCSSDHVVDRRIEWVSVASKSLPCLPEMIWGMLTCMKTGEYDPINPQGSHFSQIVWKSTLELGCAFQVCGDIFPAEYGVRKFWVEFQKRNLILIDDYTISQPAKFFVCEYQPRGNVIGEFRWVPLFVPFLPLRCHSLISSQRKCPALMELRRVLHASSNEASCVSVESW